MWKVTWIKLPEKMETTKAKQLEGGGSRDGSLCCNRTLVVHALERGDTKERHLLATRSTYQMAWSSGTFLPFLAFTMARCELLPRHNRKTVARIFLYHVAKGCKHLCRCCDATKICQNSGFRWMLWSISLWNQKLAKPVQHIQIIPSFSHDHLDTINMKTANFHLFHKPTSPTQTGQLWLDAT